MGRIQSEKIYEHDRWLAFLIGHLLTPSNPHALINTHRDNDPRLAEFVDHAFHGVIQAIGEESDDVWAIYVGTVDLHGALYRTPDETPANLAARLDPYA